jgi:hypothetical protein
MFYLLSNIMLELPDKAVTQDQINEELKKIDTAKIVLDKICLIIKLNKETKHEDGVDCFSTEEWKFLYGKCSVDKFKAERRAIEVGRSFYTAYRTPMGEAVEAHIAASVQEGYKRINMKTITDATLYELNLYRALFAIWDKRRQDYKVNIERIRKIIYKEKK